MSESQASGARPVSLEDLIALNDEIASLVRAGVPLELGLRGLGTSVHGSLRALTERLSARMQGGTSLTDALSTEGHIPPVYRAVVETGLKAGRLPEALEALTGFAQSVLELRRRISLALLYPFLVLVLAYGLFVAFMVALVPRLTDAYRSLQLPVGDWLSAMGFLSGTVLIWGPIVPAVMLLLVVWWNLSSRFLLSSTAAEGNALGQVMGATAFGGVPGVRRLLANFHRASFAELAALLIEHGVPLHETIRLAAEATGDRKIIVEAQRLADDVQAGHSLAEALQATTIFPPFMRWMMSTGERQGTLASTLRQITDIYRRRATHQADWLRLVVPIALIVLVGGGATLAYALTLFIPLTEMLSNLSAG